MNSDSPSDLDPTIVQLWTEITDDRTAWEMYELDDISKAVLFAVGRRQLTGQAAPNMSEIEVMIRLGTRATVYNKIRELTNEKWLLEFTDPEDRRARRFYLAARAVAALNAWSSIVKKIGRRRMLKRDNHDAAHARPTPPAARSADGFR